MFRVECMDLAVQPVGRRRNEAIQEPDASRKVVGTIPLQSLSGVATFNLNDLYARETSQCCSLFTEVPATRQKLKHRDNRASHRGPRLGAPPKVERTGVLSCDIYEDIGVDKHARFYRHGAPTFVSNFRHRIDRL
jgi:hypothetical protein